MDTDYWREKHLALQKALQGRTLIYLDTNYWIEFRHVKLNSPLEKPGYGEILALLDSLIEKQRIVCPVSYPLFLELMKQSDESTRLVTARLMDYYSDGICILYPTELELLEFRRLVLRLLLGENAPDLTEWIWTKCGYLFGTSFPANEKLSEIGLALRQKMSIDFLWTISLEHFAKEHMSGRPEWPGEKLSATTIASIEQHRLARRSFEEVFNWEKECLLRRLLEHSEQIKREV
jgi:hypothetical protein